MGTKPYFEDGAVTIYNGDSREILPSLGPFDKTTLLMCDPPYGISHPCNFAERGRGKLTAGNNYHDVFDDDKPFEPQWLLDLNVPSILWGGNYFAHRLPPSSGWLVWDKVRPDDLDQSTCELAWTNCIKGVRRFRHLWNGCMRDSEQGESYHPTQKPVALFTWTLSLRWMADVKTIIDPYAGSGPVGRAAKEMGKKAILFEIEEHYCEIAAKRCSQEVFSMASNPEIATEIKAEVQETFGF